VGMDDHEADVVADQDEHVSRFLIPDFRGETLASLVTKPKLARVASRAVGQNRPNVRPSLSRSRVASAHAAPVSVAS
jgi:hypothetical protein